jgi:FkbM family methyltransferase
MARVIPRLPMGRYFLVHHLRRFGGPPFVMRAAPELGGFAFRCDRRDSVAREVCFTGRYEPQETQIASRVLRPGDVFVDVGANWGYFTLAAAHWVGASGRVIAFEPEPRLFELLTANLALNRIQYVRPRRLAVAAGPGTLRFAAFHADGVNWGVSRSVTPAALADFECPAAALDDELDAAEVGPVQLTKIDVEGGEAGVLLGMRRGLRQGRYRYVLVECHTDLLAERGMSEADCLAPLFDAGYRAWLVTHTPEAHRRAARRPLAARELMRPYDKRERLGSWPHVLAAAPGAPDPA